MSFTAECLLVFMFVLVFLIERLGLPELEMKGENIEICCVHNLLRMEEITKCQNL